MAEVVVFPSSGTSLVVLTCQATIEAGATSDPADWACPIPAIERVVFHGRHVGLCRLHATTYAVWGEDAERCAVSRWGWA